MVYIYIMDYYSEIKKKRNATICNSVDETGWLSEISQMEKTNTVRYHLYEESQKKKKRATIS